MRKKLDKDGIILRILVFCLLSGRPRNLGRCINRMLSLVRSGVILRKTCQEGNCNTISRTENKIKNKFYGNIRIFLRFIANYFDNSKHNTIWIHNMSPSILNSLYDGSYCNILFKFRIRRIWEINTKCYQENGV